MPPRAPRAKGLRSRPIEYCPPLVISIHGIRTHGRWQKTFASAISGLPTKVESFDYGWYGLFPFLIPPFNHRLVDRFYDWIAMVMKSCSAVDLDKYDRRPSVVAHSHGSWILGYAMLKHEDLRFDKLIFAGSILPRDFDWATLLARDQVAFVRNECGQKDPWPARAGLLVAHTGTGGSEGFESFSTAVKNEPFPWFGHSDSLMRQHIEQHWMPVLRRRPSGLVLLHGRDIDERDCFSKMFTYTADIDQEAYGGLPNYSEVPLALVFGWVRINADIYTFLIDRKSRKLAGYINAMPVDDVTYADIRSGKLTDPEILPENIVPYVGPDTVKVYIMSIAVAEQYRQWGEGILQSAYVQLLTGFLDKLAWYGKRHRIRVTHLLATPWTPEGRRMCSQFAMTEVGEDQFGDTVFERDLDAIRFTSTPNVLPALRPLLKIYREL